MGGDASPAHMAKFFWAQLFGNAPTPTQSFAGQTIIVTGSNTGLGFEAAKHIVNLGCTKLIMAVRSVDKGESAKAAIIEATGCDPKIIEVWSIDLTSYDSVKAFAERADRELDRLDVLLENAAVASVVWNWVEDNERMITVNVVSTFLLAFLVLPKLKATAVKFNTRPRLTFVTSDTHFLVDFNEKDATGGIFNTLNDKTKSDVSDRYPTSKLIQVFIVREMAAQLPQDSTPVIINCVNPGLCKSELSREIDGPAVQIMKFLFARSAEAGSRNLVHGASGGLDTHGQYMDMGKVTKPATVVVGPGGKEAQERLYAELVEKLERIAPGVSTNLTGSAT
jgi:NAD(P)-dependent dehydrogenase (short-subunit alcohol dehydrogenase family)